MTEWYVINSSEGRADYQMAVDEAIFRLFVHDLEEDSGRACTGCLRFYRITPPAVSIGYRQEPDSMSELSGGNKRNPEIVRRITGGGAVFHGTDLTMSMIFCDRAHGYGAGILPSYRFVAEVVRDGFIKAGIKAKIVESTEEKTSPSICFDRSSKFEIESGGRKIFGCALRRHGRVVLVQSSIVFDGSQRQLVNKPEVMESSPYRSPEAPVSDKIVNEITAALGRISGVLLIRRALSVGEEVLADELLANRYGTEAWTRNTVSAGAG